MEKFKGTPGPWRVSDDNYTFQHVAHDFYHQISAGSGYLNEMKSVGFSLSGPMSIHDANLIAAAPELLKELERLREYVIYTLGVGEEDCHAEHPLMSSKSAIKKSNGRKTMKLIDLLIKELPKSGGWPEGVAAMAQDADGAVQNYSDTLDIIINDEFAHGNSRIASSYSIDAGECGVATDRLTAIITRDQYEAALAKNGGWIECGGGECPVGSSCQVDLKFRNGATEFGCSASAYYWENANLNTDIIAYRLHKPDINSRANDDRLEQDLNECIGQGVSPIQWTQTGLPLVGTECEMADEDGYYKPVEIIAWRNGCVIGWDSERLITYISNKSKDFRPLRTEAEKLRELAIDAMTKRENMGEHWMARVQAEATYEAIAAGKITGINLEAK